MEADRQGGPETSAAARAAAERVKKPVAEPIESAARPIIADCLPSIAPGNGIVAATPDLLPPRNDALSRPAYHHYGYVEILLLVKFVLHGSSSFRGAAKSLQILLGMGAALIGAPTYNSGRMWIMRLGLYELKRPLPPADDWAWIVDHTVQIGAQKCFVIAAVPLSELEVGWFSPELSQLSILAIEPVEHSNGEVVKQQLKEAVKRTGVPRMIVSDRCRELKCGINGFLDDHSSAAAMCDIKHKTALILKKALESDERWLEFNKGVNKTRQAVLPSRFAHLAPPTTKTKAKYMNMQPLIEWSERMAVYLSKPFAPGKDEICEVGQINIHFRWLREYEEDIAEWGREIEILETAVDHCRRYGYERKTATTLRPVLESLAKGERSQQVTRELLAFLEEQSQLVGEGEHLLATSECIESLFSKTKHLQKQQAASGFTSLILALAACVAKPTYQMIQEALSTVKTQAVLDWAKSKIGATVQAKRQNTLGKVKLGTESAQEMVGAGS